MRRYAMLSVFALAVLWGCGGARSPTTEAPPAATSAVRLTVYAPTRSGLAVATVVVEVTGDEIVGTLVYELPYDAEKRTASGTILVPNGQDRFFHVQALDARGVVVYEGRAGPIDIDPVHNDPITIELWLAEDLGVSTFRINLLEAIPNAYRGIGKIAICYGPFRDGQSPDLGIYPSEAEIREDLTMLKPLVTAVRTYGVTGSLEKIPAIAKELGIRCLAGAWIGRDRSANQRELQNLVAIARAGQVERVAVGNEVLLRGDLSREELLELIRQVKQQVSVPVSTGEVYQVWLENPALADACDYLLVHIHPYWQSIPVERALEHIESVYAQLRSAYPQKQIILGECGFPSGGQVNGQAVPDPVSQRRFVRQLVEWATARGVEVYLFEAFDERWKVTHEGEVGAHWGVFRSDRTMKPEIRKIWF